MEEERENQRQAKEALELADSTGSSAVADRLQVALEELTDLKEIWTELGKVTEQIEQLKDQSWQVIQPRKLRQSLDGLREQMKGFPARLRQYASYEHIMNKLKRGVVKNLKLSLALKNLCGYIEEKHNKNAVSKPCYFRSPKKCQHK